MDIQLHSIVLIVKDSKLYLNKTINSFLIFYIIIFLPLISLLIGAPLANGSMQVQSAGALFKCNTERLSGCTQVHLDKRGEEIINGTKTEKKVDQWLGATLVSSKSGFVLVINIILILLLILKQ